MASVINWFEIPAVEVDRATAFYAAVIGSTFDRDPQHPDHAFFAHGEDGVGGEVCKTENHNPSTDGVLVYLDAPNGVEDALSKVDSAGGTIVLGKTAIGPHGFIGIIVDTEGNRVGLHNMQG